MVGFITNGNCRGGQSKNTTQRLQKATNLNEEDHLDMKDNTSSHYSSFVVLLCGTHVTGKETLAVHLSKALQCPWIKAEMAHNAAGFGAKSQSKRGFDYVQVFARIWSTKLQRLGFLTDGSESEGEVQTPAPRRLGSDGCTAVITIYHSEKNDRDAIREAMLNHGVKPHFFIMQISEETLSGRTLGAEEPVLAERIMKTKISHIQRPSEEERDVILVDSLQDVDSMFDEIMNRVTEQRGDSFAVHLTSTNFSCQYN